MIKTVIFDNGGVLVNDGWLDFITKIKSRFGSEIYDQINIEAEKASRGEVNLEFLMGFIKQKIGEEALNEMYRPDFGLNAEMAEYVKEVSENFEVALLTNELSNFDNDNLSWHLDELFGEKVFCSSKIGYCKPDPRVYLFTLNKLDKRPEEVIFIDDRETNIEGARSIGINAVQFITAEQTKKDVQRIIERENAK